MEEQDQRQSRREQKQRGWQSPEHRSRHAAHLAQCLQNKLLKGDPRRGAQIIDLTVGAGRFDFLEISRQLGFKAPRKVFVEKKLAFPSGFHVDQGDVAPSLGMELSLIDDMNYQELVALRRQFFQRF